MVSQGNQPPKVVLCDEAVRENDPHGALHVRRLLDPRRQGSVRGGRRWKAVPRGHMANFAASHRRCFGNLAVDL